MSGVFRFGEWRADVRTRALTSSRESIRLERKAMDVLVEMARASPRPVTIEELMERVWAGVVVSDSALYRVIAVLRKTLKDDSRNPTYIESIPKLGYRLLVPACFEEPPREHQGPAAVSPAVSSSKFTVVTECREDVESAAAVDLAARVGRHVGWSSAAFCVLRQPEESTAGELHYRLWIEVIADDDAVRAVWEVQRGSTRELVWTSDHTETPADFAPKQDRVAELIADGMVRSIRRSRQAEWDQDPHSPSLGYWELILLSDHYRSMSPPQVEARRLMLRRALEAHPDLAPAHAAYADFLSWEVANGISRDPRLALEEARQEANTAVDLDSHDPYVLSRCGSARSRIGDHSAGVELCRRAFALAPSTATREALATVLCFAGQPEEAIAHYESLLQTMPAGHVFQYGKLVVPLVQSGRLAEALEYAERAVIHFPKDYFCWGLRANLLAHFGDLAEAQAAFARARALMPSLTLDSLIAGTNRTYGRTAEQRDLLSGGLAHLSCG